MKRNADFLPDRFIREYTSRDYEDVVQILQATGGMHEPDHSPQSFAKT